MCITTRGGAGLQASECARLIGDANTVPNNPTQQWTTTNLSQFKRATVATCAQGNGNFQYATQVGCCLLYTSDAADERSSVDLGGRRIIKKKKH